VFDTGKLRDFAIRSVIGLAIGFLFGWMLSEAAYFFTPDKQAAQRQPEKITLVIPYGTAQQVKEGVYNRSLPGELAFVQGDILVVKNEDTVAHQLGPLFIPPSTSSALSLDTADHFGYECSFQPNQFIGLDVAPRVTAGLRLEAILSIGLPTGMMLAIYSYLIPGIRLPGILGARKRMKEAERQEIESTARRTV
jgi:hypothetical protein